MEQQTEEKNEGNVFPETAKFNHLPVEFMFTKEAEVKGEVVPDKAHRKNQISFGKRLSSENTTKNFQLQSEEMEVGALEMVSKYKRRTDEASSRPKKTLRS